MNKLFTDFASLLQFYVVIENIDNTALKKVLDSIMLMCDQLCTKKVRCKRPMW